MEAQGAARYIPNTDTNILPVSLRNAIATGNFNQVPVIEGSNLNEGRLFVALNELSNGALSDETTYRKSVAGY